jgi:hypothetical protein
MAEREHWVKKASWAMALIGGCASFIKLMRSLAHISGEIDGGAIIMCLGLSVVGAIVAGFLTLAVLTLIAVLISPPG